MIQSLEIQNFLSHKKTKVEFSTGVNIIVGPTDSGKSAIVKALKWAVLNRPLGDSLRSHWGGSTCVSVKFKEGEVLRVRGDRDNAYQTKYDGAFIEFNAIKGEVPKEVEKLLDLGEVNIQTQFAPHFLLSQSSGEVAQYFNKVAHLDKIDTASQNIRRWLKDIQSKLYHKEEELQDLEQQLVQYEVLDEIEEKVVALEAIVKKIQTTSSDVELLEDLINSISKVEEEANGFTFLIELEGTVDEIIKISEIRNKERVKITELNDLVSYLQGCENDLRRHDKELTELEGHFHKELGKGKVCPLCESVL